MIQYLNFEMIMYLLKRCKSFWGSLKNKDWFYLILYTLIYLIHCLVSWQDLTKINSQIESEMILRNGFVSFWHLYPYHVFSVYLISILYLLFSYLIVSVFAKLKMIQIQSKITSFYITQFNLFFFIICILYIGNVLLGIFSDTEVYTVLVLCFWIGTYLIFVNQNGKLFRNQVLLESGSVFIFSKCIGYMIPILWTFILLLLIKR